MRKFLPNNVRFFKFSDIGHLTNDNVDYLYKLVKNTFTEGYFSSQNPNTVISAKILTYGSEKRVGIFLNGNSEFALLASEGLSKTYGNTLIKQTVFFDEINPANGSVTNKVQLENKSLFVDNTLNYSLIYSSKYFYCLYVNGTLQNASSVVVDEQGNYLNFGFTVIRAGSIDPTPAKLNGNFSKDLIENTLTYINFLQDFCNNDKTSCVLEFPYLNTELTDKALVLEVYSSSTSKKYYHIPKDIPIYQHGAFFTATDTEIYKIKLNLGNIDISSSDKIKVYFISFAIPQETNKDLNVNFINKYKLGDYKRLDPQTFSNSLILSLDENSGTFLDLSAISATSVGSILNLDIASGTLEVSASVLPYPSAKIYFKDIYYAPPLQISRNIDYSNNLTIYGYAGNTFPITLGTTYNLYVTNTINFDVVNTIQNSFSQVTNLLSSYTYLPNFILLDTSQTPPTGYILVGSVSSSPSPESVSLSIDPNFYTPYTRLQTIASNINPPPKWRSLNINKLSLSTQASTSVKVSLISVPIGKTINFKGFSFIGRVVDSSSNDVPFTIKFHIVQGNTEISSGSTFPNTGNYITSSSQIYDEVAYLTTNNNFFTVTNNSTSPYIFEIVFTSSTNQTLVNLESFVVYYELL
ncbi:MAG: hypothetical protein QXP88_00300 [Thermoproteota archaeon]